jgi:hypothetical protein
MSKIEEGIRIHAQMDIVQIYQKISENPASVVTLDIEVPSFLSTSYGLKLLIAHFPTKKFQIITTHPILKRIAEHVGIRAYSRADAIEFEQEFAKSHILRHNFTFFEYFLYEIQKLFSKVVFQYRKKSSPKLAYKKKTFFEFNILLLFIGLVLSISLLGFIFYFAVSKTFVTISPDFAVKTVSQNFIYTEGEEVSVLDTRPIIAVRRQEVKVELENEFNVASYDVTSVRSARGKVEVFNELNNEQIFRPNTRFVTEEGLVYRSQEWAKVPPTRTLSGEVIVGKTTVTLIADPYDTKGELSGDRANIWSGVILDMPGLKFNKDKIYAKSIEWFQGGQLPTLRLVTEQEVVQFKSFMIDKLKKEVLAKLKSDLDSNNALTGQDFQILEIENNLTYGEPVMEIKKGVKVGDKVPQVTLGGSITVRAYVYNRMAVLQYLRNIMNERLLQWTEKLHDMLPETLRISAVLTRVDGPKFAVRATTELSGSISYNFEDDANAQTKKLKSLIAGKPVDEAVSILVNSQSVAKARIRLSPFWLTRISGNVDNIEFTIEK